MHKFVSLCVELHLQSDTEAEGELVVGLSLEHEGLLFAFFGVEERLAVAHWMVVWARWT